MHEHTKTSSLKRLARIEGQVRGVARMIDDDRYCIDVVRQVQAVKAALNGLEKIILDDHLDTCVESALSGPSVAARREKVEELVAVLGGRKK
ncbi:MAG: metal-sensitive transcriptional regulator [Pseudomonadota bacterium]